MERQPRAVPISSLKPGRLFAYAHSPNTTGTVVRISPGSAIVHLNIRATEPDFDNDTKRIVPKVIQRTERNLAIALTTMVFPKNHSHGA